MMSFILFMIGSLVCCVWFFRHAHTHLQECTNNGIVYFDGETIRINNVVDEKQGSLLAKEIGYVLLLSKIKPGLIKLNTSKSRKK